MFSIAAMEIHLEPRINHNEVLHDQLQICPSLSDQVQNQPTQSSQNPPQSTVSGPVVSRAEFSQSTGELETTQTRRKGWKFKLAFLALATVAFASALDATILSVALPIIAEDLSGSTFQSFWAGIAYLLTCVLFQPIHTALSDIFGRKPILYLCILCFGLGAIIIGLSKGMTTLIIGRAIQGIGGGGLEALSEIILTDMTTLAERPLYIGILGIVWAGGSAFGPLVGGSFAEKASWRWIAWINLPLIAIPVVIIPPFLTLQPVPLSMRSKFGQIDWIGIAIYVPALTIFALALTWGGTLYPWTSALTVVPLTFGALLLLAFAVYEGFSKNPIIPYWLFANGTRCASLLGSFLHGITLYSVLYYIPIYFEGAIELGPLSSALNALPLSLLVATTAVVAAFAIELFRRYSWSIWLGWFLTTLGMGLLILFSARSTLAQRLGLQVLGGIGLGILYPALGIPLQAATDENQAGIAMGNFVFARQLGAILGLAIGSVAFSNRFSAEVSQLTTSPKILKLLGNGYGAVSVIPTLKELDLLPAERILIHGLYADATRAVWIAVTIVGALGFATCFFVRELSLERNAMSKQAFTANAQRS